MTITPSRLPDTATLGRTALRVSDLRSVGEFYSDVVGLEVIERGPTEATLGVDGTPLLVLIAHEDAAARSREEAGLFHNAFEVPSREALGDALHRIELLWQLDGASDHRVSESLYLTDPEDNGIEIYRDRPEETWPIDENGNVQMETLPMDQEAIRDASTGSFTTPPTTRVGHVHLEVTDLARSREFYVDTLGLGVRQVFDEMAVFLATDDYHHHVALNTWHERTEPQRGRGIAWFELVLPDQSAVAAVRERVEAAGLPTGDVESGFETEDPDGIGVRIRTDSHGEH